MICVQKPALVVIAGGAEESLDLPGWRLTGLPVNGAVPGCVLGLDLKLDAGVGL